MKTHQGYEEETGEKTTDEEKVGWCFHTPFHTPTDILLFCSLHLRRLKYQSLAPCCGSHLPFRSCSVILA